LFCRTELPYPADLWRLKEERGLVRESELYSPDIEENRSDILEGGIRVSFDLTGLKSFFVVRIVHDTIRSA